MEFARFLLIFGSVLTAVFGTGPTTGRGPFVSYGQQMSYYSCMPDIPYMPCGPHVTYHESQGSQGSQGSQEPQASQVLQAQQGPYSAHGLPSYGPYIFGEPSGLDKTGSIDCDTLPFRTLQEEQDWEHRVQQTRQSGSN